MRAENPFTLGFGKEPTTVVSREETVSKIVASFNREDMGSQLFVLSGVRGAGKTVLLTEVKKELSNRDDWITIEVNSNKDIVRQLLQKLYSRNRLRSLIEKAKIDLTVFGIGIHLEGAEPVYDDEVALEQVLQTIKEDGMRVFVAIDEVINTQFMREFASLFQILIREQLPIFLLMTGLYENISDLQDVDNLTFLYRAPKVELYPLNTMGMANQYVQRLKVSYQKGRELALLTNGYPFAFQVIGKVLWDDPDITDADMKYQLDGYLQDYVYRKIWSELSEVDKQVMVAMVNLGADTSNEVKIGDVRERLDMKSGKMAVYRDRLIKKGLIKPENYGHVCLALPRFDVFVKEYAD